MHDPRAVLRSLPLFASLDDAACDTVLAVMAAKRGGPGDVLFREGEASSSLVVVVEGELVARARTHRGVEEELVRVGPGGIVGELAFLDAAPRSATVSTPGGATVMEFSRDAFARLRRDAPAIAAAILRNVLADLARRLRAQEDRVDAISARASAPAPRPGRNVTAAQLAGAPALTGLGKEDLELLAYVATLRRFAADERLMEEGTPGDACWLLLSGRAVVTRAWRPKPLATLGPGAIVGHLALLDCGRRSATVTATAPVDALEVRADAFARLVASPSPIAVRFQEQVVRAAVRELRAATQRRLSGDWDPGPSGRTQRVPGAPR